MSKKQDYIFFRNFSAIVAALALMMVSFYVIAIMVGTDEDLAMKQRAAAVAETTAPVGQVAVATDVAPESQEMAQEMTIADPAAIDGEAIYTSLCFACHGIAGIGAPVLGNVEEWAPRIAKGKEILYSNSINGFIGPNGFMMPARGGGNLSDDEVKAAVDYMVTNSQ